MGRSHASYLAYGFSLDEWDYELVNKWANQEPSSDIGGAYIAARNLIEPYTREERFEDERWWERYRALHESLPVDILFHGVDEETAPFIYIKASRFEAWGMQVVPIPAEGINEAPTVEWDKILTDWCAALGIQPKDHRWFLCGYTSY